MIGLMMCSGGLAGARRARSEQASLGQRHAHAVAHDDVVEQANVDQGKRFLHALRDELVRVTGLGDAAPAMRPRTDSSMW
jgi:hypothetical protein